MKVGAAVRDWTIGIDLGDRVSDVCVLDRAGAVRDRKRVATKRGAVSEALSGHEGSRVILEAGTHSPWLSLEHQEEFDVVVANPRRARLIAQNSSKNDAFDTELLGRLGRIPGGRSAVHLGAVRSG